jgi:hypothetical protein
VTPARRAPRFWPAIVLLVLGAVVTTAASALLQAWVIHLGLTWGLG